jgi:hypothetical protein
MALIIGLFEDTQQLQKGLEALQDADVADDIVQVVESQDALTPEGGPVAVAPSGTGGGAPMGAVAAAPFGMKAAYLERLGDARDFFVRAIEQGGCAVILESRDDEKVAAILQRAGAQQVYNN